MVWTCLLGLFIFYGAQFANGQATDISKAMTDTSIKLLKNADKSGNTLFSPLAISLSMGMLYTGAKGNTQSQIGQYLFSGLTDQDVNDQLRSQLKGWDKEIQNSTDLEKLLSDRLYIQAGHSALPEYISKLKTYYQSDVRSLDFKNNAESARQEINSYVEDQTNHTFKDLFPPHSLDKSVMVLVHAEYGKTIWKNKFDVSQTSKKYFSSNENDKSMVDMMSKSGASFYYNDNDADVLVLGVPLADEPDKDEVIAYFIVPFRRFGLDDAIKSMTSDRFRNLIKNAKMTTIQRIDIPKFKLDMALPSQSFQMLGVTDAFNPDKADFSGINGFKDLYASDIIHKVSLEISEDGVDAANTIATAGAIQRPIVFSVDQPFILAIVEKSSLDIGFLGRFSKLA